MSDLGFTINARHGVAEVTVRLPDGSTLADVVDALLENVLPGLGFADVERRVAEMFGQVDAT